MEREASPNSSFYMVRGVWTGQ